MDDKKRRQIRDIAEKELKSGKSPAELNELAVAAGIPQEVVTEEFQHLSTTPDFLFAGILAEFLKTSAKPKSVIDVNPDTFWDPAGEEVTIHSFHGLRKELEEKAKTYVVHPSLPLRNLLLFSIPLLFMLAFALLRPKSLMSVAGWGEGDGMSIFLLPFIPPILYIGYVFKIQRDIIKLMIANSNGWLYNPGERSERWLALKLKFPEIFQKGNTDQNIQDEFWGNVEFARKSRGFWMGIFEYVIESHGDKGRKNRQTKYCNVFALELPKTLKCDFRLEPEHFGHKIRNFFSRKEINTESAKFNTTFAVFYKGEKVEKQLEIIKILSPSVQVRLLEMKNRFGKFTLLFRENAVVIAFPGNLLKWMKTNFFRQVALDPRDKEVLNERLQSVLVVSADIVRFLD